MSFNWEGGSDGGWAPDCNSGTLETQWVRIPPLPLIYRVVIQLVECYIWDVVVASSSLVYPTPVL